MMTPEEFKIQAHEALSRANETADRIMSSLDGWLIGAAAALLSLPALLRGEVSLLGPGAWRLFAVSTVLLALSLVGVLGRNLLMWYRIQYAAATVNEMQAAADKLRSGADDAKFEATVKARRKNANRLRTWEIRVFIATFVLFAAGVTFYGFVAVLRTWPANVPQ